ncbi:phage terminase large subunit [Paenibacillus motobuensis]|uniref:phage terminase large subunit n=1 Tax=Paenibacillus TaxID=44249 RepID=UPI00203DA7C0|nr:MULTISPECIES: phage terminase large subunit [Paenibacillus]MCM3041703.1 phage terminase large subunit [Paenibacillus lutimineralis]MCM3648807.1 phage terminase large subunit [Paenibacillus motobuensis]
MVDLDTIKRYARIELARREFFGFCQAMAPDFYKDNRQYLIDLCNEMQDFYESDDDILIINEPPRHGKSRTASMFAQWVFGQNPQEKVMTGSYNETLSTTFSKAVRNGISTIKADPEVIVYSDIFPQVQIKRGDGAMNLWSLEGGYNSYLATSPTGTATGFGASILIIDDLIKNAEEANNEAVLEKHWDWFTNTMLSRLEEGGKIIIIMTRWATGDLAGRALEHFAEEKKKVRHLTMKALQDDGTMLCEEILSRESYDMKVRAMGEDIASANYQQIPIDIKGKLYSSFKTYTELPKDFSGIYSYCDTADQGDDYLCNIIWGVYNKEAYVLDVIYTKQPMEITEPAVAQALFDLQVNRERIESNSGGRAFARNVRRILETDLNSNRTDVSWFHQSKNKIARIVSNATWVMDHIYFPVNWRDRWPDYYKAMTSYQREGKNAHDDAPDATTGVAETMYLLGG